MTHIRESITWSVKKITRVVSINGDKMPFKRSHFIPQKETSFHSLCMRKLISKACMYHYYFEQFRWEIFFTEQKFNPVLSHDLFLL